MIETSKEITPVPLKIWATPLVSMSILWLLSFAIMKEGFPSLPIPTGLAFSSFFVAILISLIALWKSWAPVEMLAFSFFPLLLLPVFDEITTAYKTSFIILCAMIMTIGLVLYQRLALPRLVGGIILLGIVILTWLLAHHAAANFWHMSSELGVHECFLDAVGCPQLTGEETPWWVLFFWY